MTNLQEFGADLDALHDQYKDYLKADGTIEGIIEGLIALIESDKERYIKDTPSPHKGVIACLDGACQHLAAASLAYYCSFK